MQWKSKNYDHGLRGFLRSEDGKEYFFKAKDKKRAFKELLAQEVAEILKIKHINYKPYSIDENDGVISESFIKPGYRYMSGEELVSKYIEKTKSEHIEFLYIGKDNNGKDVIKNNQDLYLVWQALEQEFNGYPNYAEQIKTFMNDMIIMILFDLLIVNFDRVAENWFIEYNGSNFRLVEVLDNDYSFSNLMDSALIVSQYVSHGCYNSPTNQNTNALETLIRESDGSAICDQFTNFCSLANPNNIRMIIDYTIKKNSFPLDEETINELVNNFTVNYNSLQTVIGNQTNSKDKK